MSVKRRRSYETGHRPKFMVVIDETPECGRAVAYAARRAKNTGGSLILLFVIDEHGRVVIDSARVSIKDLRGILPKPDRAVTLEEMDEAIAQGAAERASRR